MTEKEKKMSDVREFACRCRASQPWSPDSALPCDFDRCRSDVSSDTVGPSLHRAGNRGNRCMGERDVELLATATANYRAVLVHSYGCVSADRIVCQLREAGGDFSKLADKYESLVNGRRILADRVRLMIKETRKQKGLPSTKFARFKSAPDDPAGSDENG